MKVVKRIIALFSAFAICLSLFVVPAYAVPALPSAGSIVASGFAGWILKYMNDHADEAIAGGINKLHRIFDSDVCTSGKAENGRHKFVQQTTAVDGQTGEYYVCEYCGKSGGEVFDTAYDSYVGDMPVNGIDSAGSFFWYPTCDDLDFDSDSEVLACQTTFKFNTLPSECVGGLEHLFLSSNGNSIYVKVLPTGDDIQTYYVRPYLSLYFKSPISGIYQKLSGARMFTGKYSLTNGKTEDFSFDSVGPFSSFHKNAGQVFNTNINYNGQNIHFESVKWVTGVWFYCHLPVYSVIPDDSIDSTLYTPDTRPGTITGKYLVQNGDAYEDSSTTIINEDDNSIYNPVTNTTTNYDSWSYDYSTRTYTMTDNTNNSVSTVTYGDENITINEGGNTYNVYYGTVINNNGGDDSGNGGNNGGTDIDFPSNTGIDTLGERLKVYFQRLPEMMGDINNFLSDAFPYIPQDLLYLIEFSLTISLFMAIIKMIRR